MVTGVWIKGCMKLHYNRAITWFTTSFGWECGFSSIHSVMITLIIILSRCTRFVTKATPNHRYDSLCNSKTIYIEICSIWLTGLANSSNFTKVYSIVITGADTEIHAGLLARLHERAPPLAHSRTLHVSTSQQTWLIKEIFQGRNMYSLPGWTMRTKQGIPDH